MTQIFSSHTLLVLNHTKDKELKAFPPNFTRSRMAFNHDAMTLLGPWNIPKLTSLILDTRIRNRMFFKPFKLPGNAFTLPWHALNPITLWNSNTASTCVWNIHPDMTSQSNAFRHMLSQVLYQITEQLISQCVFKLILIIPTHTWLGQKSSHCHHLSS